MYLPSLNWKWEPDSLNSFENQIQDFELWELFASCLEDWGDEGVKTLFWQSSQIDMKSLLLFIFWGLLLTPKLFENHGRQIDSMCAWSLCIFFPLLAALDTTSCCIQNAYLIQMKFPKKLKCVGSIFCFTTFIRLIGEELSESKGDRIWAIIV